MTSNDDIPECLWYDPETLVVYSKQLWSGHESRLVRYTLNQQAATPSLSCEHLENVKRNISYLFDVANQLKDEVERHEKAATPAPELKDNEISNPYRVTHSWPNEDGDIHTAGIDWLYRHHFNNGLAPELKGWGAKIEVHDASPEGALALATDIADFLNQQAATPAPVEPPVDQDAVRELATRLVPAAQEFMQEADAASCNEEADVRLYMKARSVFELRLDDMIAALARLEGE